MRNRHDNSCPWWKDWHNCSCGFLEEELRIESRKECFGLIPNTFIVCGEDGNYCSQNCWDIAKAAQQQKE